MEICPEEFSNNVPAHLMLHGHLKPVLTQVCPAKKNGLNLEKRGNRFRLSQLVEEFGQWVMDRDGQWWSRLKEKIHSNMNINKVYLSLSLSLSPSRTPLFSPASSLNFDE